METDIIDFLSSFPLIHSFKAIHSFPIITDLAAISCLPWCIFKLCACKPSLPHTVSSPCACIMSALMSVSPYFCPVTPSHNCIPCLPFCFVKFFYPLHAGSQESQFRFPAAHANPHESPSPIAKTHVK